MKHNLTIFMMLLSSFLFGSCDMLTKIDDIRFPLTMNIEANVNNDVPNIIRYDVVKLDTISGFSENYEKLDASQTELKSMSFTLTNYQCKVLPIEQCTFENVTFWLQYDPQYGDHTIYPLGSYTNVKAKDFYNTPNTITFDPEKVKAALRNIKERPIVRIYQEYGKIIGYPTQQPVFEKLYSSLSLTVLLKTDL